MRNLIPEIIHNNYMKQKDAGEIEGSVLFIDIVGFTELTESLIVKGDIGAEIVSEIINKTFKPCIEKVNLFSGFISTFAGDAMTAVFPGESVISAIICAKEIIKIFKSNIFKIDRKEIILKPRIGISFGKVNWKIIKNEIRFLYCFYGNAVNKSIISEQYCQPGEIIFDESVKKMISENIQLIKKKQNYYSAGELNDSFKTLKKKKNSYKSKYQVLEKFIPKEIMTLKTWGEFRNIASVFISFSSKELFSNSGEIFGQFIGKILKYTEKYGGYLNKINFGDKGNVILILFGAPKGIENLYLRSAEFTFEVLNNIKDIYLKAGISCGASYTGFIGSSISSEYTALGEVVNLSSRYMSIAAPGEILFDVKIKKELENYFLISKKGSFSLKGVSGRRILFKLSGKKIEVQKLYSGRMFGRKQELNILKKQVTLIKRNEFGGIVYIDGFAGIGKSRLTSELLGTFPKDEFKAFYLTSDEVVRDSFNPFKYFFRKYFKQDDKLDMLKNRDKFDVEFNNLIESTRDHEVRNELERTKMFLGSVLSLSWPGSDIENLDPATKFKNIGYAIRIFFIAQSLKTPVLLIFEDLHWIDSDSARLLNIICENLKSRRILLIAVTRLNNDGSPFRIKIRGVKELTVQIDKLDIESTQQMITDLTKYPVTAKLLNLIHEKTSGNPFYIEQTVSYLLESGNLILNQNNEFEIKGDFKVPEKISMIIISRIDRLSENLRNLIKTASILGREFSVKLLSAMLKGRLDFSELTEIEQENIWQAFTELTYIFKHALIRDSIYQMQLHKTRKELHYIAAKAIEKIFKNKLEQYYSDLIYHYYNTGIKSKLKYYLIKGKNYSEKNYLFHDAIKYLDILIELEKNVIKKLNFLNDKSVHLEKTGDWSSAEKHYINLLELSEKHKNKRITALAYYHLGTLYDKLGKMDLALEYLEKSLELYRSLKDEDCIIVLINAIGNHYYFTGNFKKSVEFLLNAQDKLFKLKKEKGAISIVTLVITHIHLGMIYSITSEFKKAEKHLRKAIQITKKDKLLYYYQVSLFQMGNLYLYQGNYGKALEYYEMRLKLAKQYGDKQGIAYTLGNMGNIFQATKQYDKALEAFKNVFTISEELGDIRSISTALGNIGLLYCAVGKLNEALDCFRKKLKLSKQLQSKESYIYTYSGFSELYFIKNDLNRTIRFGNKSILLRRELGIKQHIPFHYFDMALISYKFNKLRQARKYSEAAVKSAKEINDQETLLKAEILLARLNYKNTPEETLKKLKEIIKDKDNIHKQAFGYYFLYDLLKKNTYKRKARNAFEKINSRSPHHRNKIMIESLER